MKKLLLVLGIILLTGCSGEYNLTITDKKRVEENLIISVSNEQILQANNSVDEYLDHYAYVYSTSDNFKNYLIKTKKSNPNSYFKITRNYKDLEQYIESNSFKSMFIYADILDTGKYLEFTSSRNDYIYNYQNNMLESADATYDSFKINIKFYNEVVEHNADEVDKKNNIYTWNVDINRSADESYIYFKTGPKVLYLIKLKDYIKKNMVTIIFICSVFGAIALILLYILYKNKKNNEI